jgi:predicted ArsR family transcriptional regulator
MNMNGLTAVEIGNILGIPAKTVKKRLERAKIQPVTYAGPTAIYDESALKTIRNVPGRGRPKKDKKPEK